MHVLSKTRLISQETGTTTYRYMRRSLPRSILTVCPALR